MATYYFAYGADLDPEDLGLRCSMRRRQHVRFAKSTPAYLKGYKLTANIPSHYRQGGIFNITPDPEGTVHGAVYELHAGDTISAAMMKEGEGASYLLAVETVHAAKGKTFQALVLRADAAGKTLMPSQSYLDVVLKAAKKHKLPAEWIATLQSLKT